jgi:hypothetical protein
MCVYRKDVHPRGVHVRAGSGSVKLSPESSLFHANSVGGKASTASPYMHTPLVYRKDMRIRQVRANVANMYVYGKCVRMSQTCAYTASQGFRQPTS